MKKTTIKNPIYMFVLILLFSTTVFLSCNFQWVPFDGDPASPPNVLSKEDSIAIRGILDDNGLASKKVREVILLGNSMVIQINIDSCSLSEFYFTNNFNLLKSRPALNLRNNQIDSLLFLDTIQNDMTVRLDFNKLRSISSDINKMRGVLSLYLDYNELTSISPNIMNCNVSYINVKYNHLMSISDTSLVNWISRVGRDSTWRDYQTPGL